MKKRLIPAGVSLFYCGIATQREVIVRQMSSTKLCICLSMKIMGNRIFVLIFLFSLSGKAASGPSADLSCSGHPSARRLYLSGTVLSAEPQRIRIQSDRAEDRGIVYSIVPGAKAKMKEGASVTVGVRMDNQLLDPQGGAPSAVTLHFQCFGEVKGAKASCGGMTQGLADLLTQGKTDALGFVNKSNRQLILKSLPQAKFSPVCLQRNVFDLFLESVKGSPVDPRYWSSGSKAYEPCADSPKQEEYRSLKMKPSLSDQEKTRFVEVINGIGRELSFCRDHIVPGSAMAATAKEFESFSQQREEGPPSLKGTDILWEKAKFKNLNLQDGPIQEILARGYVGGATAKVGSPESLDADPCDDCGEYGVRPLEYLDLIKKGCMKYRHPTAIKVFREKLQAATESLKKQTMPAPAPGASEDVKDDFEEIRHEQQEFPRLAAELLKQECR